MSTYTDASLIVTPNSKKAGKLYALKGADLDVVRATTATYVGSDGLIKTALANEVRFDYTNGSCPSILVEPQRTNSLLRSEQFDDAYWTKLSSTILSNNIISPSGTLTADKFNSNTVNTEHRVVRDISLPSVVETLSVFAKKGEYNFLGFRVGILGAFRQLNFNLENGTFTNYGEVGTYTNIQIQHYGDGWWRCSASFLRTNTLVQFHVLQDNIAIPNYIGDNNSGVFIWGAQLEAGANATSYIPTVASAVTRNADVISKTGIRSLINSQEGVLFFNLRPLLPVPTLGTGYSLSNDTNAELIFMNFTSTANRLIMSIVNSNGVNLNVNIDGVNFSIFNKIAIKWKQNELKVFINSVNVYSNLSFNTFSTNALSTIKFARGDNQRLFEGLVNSSLIFPTALTDQQCIDLTTL